MVRRGGGENRECHRNILSGSLTPRHAFLRRIEAYKQPLLILQLAAAQGFVLALVRYNPWPIIGVL